MRPSRFLVRGQLASGEPLGFQLRSRFTASLIRRLLVDQWGTAQCADALHVVRACVLGDNIHSNIYIKGTGSPEHIHKQMRVLPCTTAVAHRSLSMTAYKALFRRLVRVHHCLTTLTSRTQPNMCLRAGDVYKCRHP